MNVWDKVKASMHFGGNEIPVSEMQEFKIFNPLMLKIGDFVRIDAPPLSGNHLVVRAIDEYTRIINNEKYPFTHYVITSEKDQDVILRMYDKEKALLLWPDCDMAYNDEFHHSVLPSGVLEVKDDNGLLIGEYNRVDNLKLPFVAIVKEIDNPVDPPKQEKCEIWDFSRKIGDQDEYYIVHMNLESGWFQMFKGGPINVKDIILINS